MPPRRGSGAVLRGPAAWRSGRGARENLWAERDDGVPIAREQEQADVDIANLARDNFFKELFNTDNPQAELINNSLKDKQLILVLESQLNGYMTKAASLVNIIKIRDREIAKLKKQLATIAN